MQTKLDTLCLTFQLVLFSKAWLGNVLHLSACTSCRTGYNFSLWSSSLTYHVGGQGRYIPMKVPAYLVYGVATSRYVYSRIALLHQLMGVRERG